MKGAGIHEQTGRKVQRQGKGPIDSVIPGAKRPEQILENLKSLEVNLSEEERNEIESIFR